MGAEIGIAFARAFPALPANDAARLQLVAWQAPERHGRDLEPDAEAHPERLLDARCAGGIAELHQDADFLELSRPEHLDLELVHVAEPPHDPFDGGRKHVDAAHDQHVVEPPEDAALEAPERAAAG